MKKISVGSIVFGIVVLVLDILYMVTAGGARMVLGFAALFLAFALIALGLIGLDWTWRKKNGR